MPRRRIAFSEWCAPLEQGLAEVGCTAEIITVVKEYPDGRLDLVAEGRNRFEIVPSIRIVPSCKAKFS